MVLPAERVDRRLEILFETPTCIACHYDNYGSWDQGLSRLCVQRVIWTPRTLFFDSLDTQIILSEFAADDFS